MLDLLLDERTFAGAMLALALLAPAAAWLAFRVGWIARRRAAIALGAFGPAAFVLLGVHKAVLATLGFASVWSVVVMIGGCALLGAGAGLWIRAERPGAEDNDGGSAP